MLFYSIEKYGMLFFILYWNSNMMIGFLLFVVGDKEGVVFGGLIMVFLVLLLKKKY